jgi:hypothetical protein
LFQSHTFCDFSRVLFGIRGAIIPSFGLQNNGEKTALPAPGPSAAGGGLAQGPGALERLPPGRRQFGKIGLENGGFGDEDIRSGIEIGKGVDEKSAQAAFGPIALDGVAHFLAGDEGDSMPFVPAKKEDEPGGMPDFVRPLVDTVELTLAGDRPKVFYTANLFLPLARRALMTLRPFLVFIRVRKPWVRLRGVLWG